MPTVERRNYQARARLVIQLVAWLRTLQSPAPQVPEEIADQSVATRILKRLALLSLVRKSPDGWLPNSVLRQPDNLFRVRENEMVG